MKISILEFTPCADLIYQMRRDARRIHCLALGARTGLLERREIRSGGVGRRREFAGRYSGRLTRRRWKDLQRDDGIVRFPAGACREASPGLVSKYERGDR